MEADQLEVCNDSQLVVKHIEDDYEEKGEKMIRYLKSSQKVKNMSRACQDLPSPNRATDLDHKPFQQWGLTYLGPCPLEGVNANSPS